MDNGKTGGAGWLRPSGVAVAGVVVSVAAAFVPVTLRERAASANIASVATTVADRIDSSFTRQLDAMATTAEAVPGLVPVPEEIATRLSNVKIPAEQGLFTDVMVIAKVGESIDNVPILALRLSYETDGAGLQFAGMSAGTSVSDFLAAARLPEVPAAKEQPKLLRIRGKDLRPEMVGPIETGGANTVIPDTLPMLAVPVPARGWVLSIAKPAGIDPTVSAVANTASVAVSLHVGPGESGPVLAERRAVTPPEASSVRRRSATFRQLNEDMTIIVGADRYYGTKAGMPPFVVLLAGLLITVLASVGVSLRRQRRARLAMEQAFQRERTLARTDPLTGLANRLAFNEAMDAELASHPTGDPADSADSADSATIQHPVAVLLCDLDRFKVVNDARGHEVGDQLLCDVAGRLGDVATAHLVSSAGTAAVYRFGGDEFVIALTGHAAESAVDFAHQLVTAIRRPFRVGHDQVVIGVSVGLATLAASKPGHTTRSMMLRDADMAMYVAKRGGGNRVAVADDSVRDAGLSQLDLEIELRRALGTGQLRAWYQPLVNPDREATALEALIRWEHPTRGLLSPGVFLPAAKDAGLLAEVSTAVLAEASRDVADWNRRREAAGLKPLVVHVNCVEEQLMDTGFADVVGSYLADSGLDPHSLLLEISEETALDRLPASLPTLDLLRSGGVRFSIDDFGFGNSSLTMVRRVGEVAELKIDKSIVDGLALASPKQTDLAVIRSIVEFCATQHITVVAEGIEEEHQFSQLVELGVELFQGYLFHRPQPAEKLDQLLAPTPAGAGVGAIA